MYSRAVMLAVVLALTISTSKVDAASRMGYVSAPLGFSVRVPATWRPLVTTRPGIREVQFTYQGATNYTLDVTVLSVKGGSSTSTLKHNFLVFEKHIGNSAMATMHWSASRFAGRNAISSIYALSTEGGTSVADGIYVVPWRNRTYVITMVSLSKPAPKSLSQFPAAYKQALATWRFI